MQAITQRVVMRAVFGPAESAHPPGLGAKLTALTAWLNTPRNLTKLALYGPTGSPAAVVSARRWSRSRRRWWRRRRSAGSSDDPPGVASMLAQMRHEDGTLLGERECATNC